jgi:hypothetical protein
MLLERRIGLDIARLCGVTTGTKKKKIQWGTVIFTGILAGISGWGAWDISRHRFQWWSLPLWIFTGLTVISIFGQFTNREIPEQEPTVGEAPGSSDRYATKSS